MRATHPPMLVRTYQDDSEEKAARRFEKDSQALSRDGYTVASVATNHATSTLSWWAWPAAKVAMTVTYVRRPR